MHEERESATHEDRSESKRARQLERLWLGGLELAHEKTHCCATVGRDLDRCAALVEALADVDGRFCLVEERDGELVP